MNCRAEKCAPSTITADPENGHVLVPTTSAGPDYYGGLHKGNSQYADAVVALNAMTAVVWSFQTVHHDTVKEKPAVAVASKTGNLFLLDRMTGKPLFGFEERRVPRSDVPGEEASSTRPFPLLPARSEADRIEAWGPTPEEINWWAEQFSKLRYDGLFTPPSLEGSLLYPGNIGGIAWGGVAFDRKWATLIFPYNRLAAVARLVPRAELDRADKERPCWETAAQQGAPYGMQRTFLLSAKGAPCSPPPFGLLVALDANSGKEKRKVPVGNLPLLGEHPEWDSPARGGPIATAGGLVFDRRNFRSVA